MPDNDEPRNYWPAIAALVMAGLLVAAIIGFTQKSSRTAGEPAPAEASATVANLGDDEQPMDGGSGGPPTATPTPTPDRNPVEAELIQFVEAFYQIEPTDSTDSRRQRFAAAGLNVATDLASRLNFTVYTQSVSDQQRINGQLVQTGRLANDERTVTDVNGDGQLYYVVAPVIVILTAPDGETSGARYVMTGTVWQQTSLGWQLTSFNDDYLQPGGQ